MSSPVVLITSAHWHRPRDRIRLRQSRRSARSLRPARGAGEALARELRESGAEAEFVRADVRYDDEANICGRTEGVITTINIFTVDPADQRRLIDLLARATDELVCRAPGFISSTLHRSLDGSKVAMYAQWRSIEDYEAMRRDPGPVPFLEEALKIARFEPGMYETERTFTAPGGDS